MEQVTGSSYCCVAAERSLLASWTPYRWSDRKVIIGIGAVAAIRCMPQASPVVSGLIWANTRSRSQRRRGTGDSRCQERGAESSDESRTRTAHALALALYCSRLLAKELAAAVSRRSSAVSSASPLRLHVES